MKLKKFTRMKKKIFLAILVVFVSLLASYLKTTSSGKSKQMTIDQRTSRQESPAVTNKENNSNKPPIIDYFACGDYCPGPKENYMVKVYSGVTDPEECKKIGGIPSSFTGWGITHFCRVP